MTPSPNGLIGDAHTRVVIPRACTQTDCTMPFCQCLPQQPQAAHAATGEGEDYSDDFGPIRGVLSWPGLLSAATVFGAIAAAIFGWPT